MGKKLSDSEFERNFVLFSSEHLVGLFVYIHAVFIKEFCRVLLQFSLDQLPWGLRVGGWID